LFNRKHRKVALSSSDNDAESSDPAAVVNMAPDHNYDNPCRSTTCSEQVDQLKGSNFWMCHLQQMEWLLTVAFSVKACIWQIPTFVLHILKHLC